MLIIGLVGGCERGRSDVAAAVVGAGGARLAEYSMRSPKNGRSRVKLLRDVVLNFGVSKSPDIGLVLTHVKTWEEAEYIRSLGGYLWHIEGMPSSDIAIQRCDLMVTPQSGGVRHYLDPVDALSETMMRCPHAA